MNEEISGPLKVFELAKKLNTDSLSLLAELKKNNIVVKSHMSVLEDADIKKAIELLGAKSAPKTTKKAAAKKTKAVRKKAAPVRKRTASATTEAVATDTADVAAATVSSEEVTPKKKRSKAVLRKRTKASDGSTISEKVKSEKEKKAEAKAALEKTKDDDDKPKKKEVTINQIEDLINETDTEEATETSQVKKPFLTVVEAATPKIKITKPAEKEVVSDKSKKPARTFDDPRVVKMTKENIDQMVADEAAKKSRGAKERLTKPEDVRFNDYRKKEMVFLPKRKKIPTGKQLKKTQITTPKASKRIVEVNETISVQDLANQLNTKTVILIKKLMTMGQPVTANQFLDFDTVSLIATEFGYEAKNVAFDESTILHKDKVNPEDLVTRPPVVTIMGHVDHGKTTLLDAIRESKVAAGEAGGITQHIGAYTVEAQGKKITFIDTPGHEAFTAMRARGANITDIVILVVAADDGVMPQTREAISHAQAAKVPIIVAVNKIDKPAANPEKIKQALAELNLLAEDWGGDTMFVPVSALEKKNLDQLLEAILLNTELLELKSSEKVKASGIVIEAKTEKGRGPVATVLVQEGTLSHGNSLVAGKSVGRVRALVDHLGKQIKSIGPGMAAEVLGLESTPSAGDLFNVTEDEASARKVSNHRIEVEKQKLSANRSKMSLEELFAQADTGNMKELKVVLRADVFGSLEAIKESLEKIVTDKVKVNVIFSSTGGITESDVLLASASHAIILGFNVRPDTNARKTAENEKVEVKCYNIIYELLEEIKKAMTGLLDKKEVEKFLGRAEVRQVFSIPKAGVIAGSAVIDGKILRNAHVRLLRDSAVIYTGKMDSLKRFKDDAKEVATGYECGIGLENYNDIKPGDIIEAFEIELISQEL